MSDLDLDDLTRLDRQAALVAAGYTIEGMPAFMLRTTQEGNVRIIGPRLPRELVCRMLRSAATAYESQPFEYDN